MRKRVKLGPAEQEPPVKADIDAMEDEESKPVRAEDNVELRSTIRKLESNGKVNWVQTCPYCICDTLDLVSHIKVSHKGKPWTGIKTACPIEYCGKDIVDIRNHIKLVHDKVRKFPCNLCHLTFSNSSLVRKHINGVHKGLKKECPECHILVKENYLKAHIKKIHGGETKRVKCSAGCDKSYTNKADMDRHVLRVHLRYKVKCEYCDVQLNPDKMSSHVRKTHQGVYKIYCKICQAGFDSEKSCRYHTSMVHTGIFAVCNVPKSDGQLCQMKLRTEEGCYEHTKKHLSKDKLVKCKNCHSEVYSCFIDEHRRLVHTKQPAICCFEGCDTAVKQKMDMSKHFAGAHPDIMEHLDWCTDCKRPVFYLPSHMKMFHSDDYWTSSQFKPLYKIVIGLMCKEDDCKFFAVNKDSLNRHMKHCHEKPVKQKCEECQKIVNDLEKHKINFHSVDKVHVCPTCSKGFTTRNGLTAHLAKHTKKKEKCPHCGYELANLRQHINAVHKGIKKYKCDVENCTTSFTSNLAKRKHMLHVHEGFKFTCEICSKEVVSLKAHIRTVHEKVRAYGCPECGKHFQSKSHLRNHVARVHLKIREECPDCGKWVQDLYSHNLYVHKKTRNFPCDQCNTRCHTSTSLRIHIKSVHLGEKVKCEGCNLKFSKIYLAKHQQRCNLASKKSKDGETAKNEED